MAFKTANSGNVPARQFARALQVAAQVKNEAATYRAQALAGSVRVADLQTGLLGTLTAARVELTAAAATPGIGGYAKNQVNDPAYDIGVEFTAMTTEIDAATAFLEANFPVGAGGHLAVWKFVGDGSGAVVSDTITAAGTLAALVAQLDTLIATID